MQNIQQISDNDNKNIKLHENTPENIKASNKELAKGRWKTRLEAFILLTAGIAVVLFAPNKVILWLACTFVLMISFTWLMKELAYKSLKEEGSMRYYIEFKVKSKLPFEKNPDDPTTAYLS